VVTGAPGASFAQRASGVRPAAAPQAQNPATLSMTQKAATAPMP
jgi:hypothetical protein